MKNSNFKISMFSISKVVLIVFLLGLFLHITLDTLTAQPGPMWPKKFIPYEQFIADTKIAKFEDFAKRVDSKVLNNAEFLKMKRHILSMYESVIVKNSFVIGNNGHVDCIDVNTQPSLRQGGKKLTIRKPPPPLIIEDNDRTPKAKYVQSMLSREKKDRFGNVMFCEGGFVPMRRITLDELIRFKTLDDFFNKFGKAGKSGIPVAK